MTEEQQKAIDACKDQIAKKDEFEKWEDLVNYFFLAKSRNLSLNACIDRAMQIYGEQCVNGKALEIYCAVLQQVNGFNPSEIREVVDGSTYTDDPLYCTILNILTNPPRA